MDFGKNRTSNLGFSGIELRSKVRHTMGVGFTTSIGNTIVLMRALAPH